MPFSWRSCGPIIDRHRSCPAGFGQKQPRAAGINRSQHPAVRDSGIVIDLDVDAMTRSTAAVAVLALAAGTVSAAGQQTAAPAQAPPPIFRSGVDIVTI